MAMGVIVILPEISGSERDYCLLGFEDLRFILGLEGLSRDLRTMGYSLCIAGQAGNRIVQLIYRLQLYGICKYVLLAKDMDSGCLEECRKSMGLPSCEIILVGNSIERAIDAKALGMKTVLLRNGEHAGILPEDEPEAPDLVTSDIRDVIDFAARGERENGNDSP